MDGWADKQIDGQMDGSIFTLTTHCLHPGLNLWWLSPELERRTKVTQSILSRLSCIVFHTDLQKHKCSQKRKGKRKPSNFPTQKVLPKVHPSTLDSGRNVRGNFQHTPSFWEKPEQACTSIRLLQGREECMCLPYNFLMSGKGYGKTRHLHSCCPWSQQPSPRPSLWEMHQIKLNDQ